MAGKFVLKKSSSGKYHFNLVASNGQVIATSEAYERKASALNGIESVKKNAPDAEVDDQSRGVTSRFPAAGRRDARGGPGHAAITCRTAGIGHPGRSAAGGISAGSAIL